MNFKMVDPTTIVIKRDERQRKEIEIDDLVESIKKYGILQPIIITKDNVLVAGERRLTTALALKLTLVPVRLEEDLDEKDRQIIELHENMKRIDLTWQEKCEAVAKIHQLYSVPSEKWSIEDTAREIGLKSSMTSNYIRLWNAIKVNPKLSEAQTYQIALNILKRQLERRTIEAMSDIGDAVDSMFESMEQEEEEKATKALEEVSPKVPKALEDVEIPTVPKRFEHSPSYTPASAPAPQVPKAPRPKTPLFLPAEESILHENFAAWAGKYSGPKFNFIHCDFPYGIDVFAGKQSGREKHGTYSDSADTYWQLLRALCSNLNNLMTPSGHILFWFSMKYYEVTKEFFAEEAPSLLVQDFPVIWHKTDNVGILPDPKRQPRRVYETAFIITREDMPIAKAVSNVYGAPTDKSFHVATKPESMLRHFFQMFVDDTTRMLDPTCGSGSALRAAESLGAKYVLGLEIDEEHCENARTALRKFRSLRAIA